MNEIVALQWQETMSIRHCVLWPEKPAHFCQLPDDEKGLHFGVKIKGELVCVASLFWVDNSIRLRKFATLPEHQGKGIGSELLRFMIKEMQKQGAAVFFCDARTTAASFYNQFGLTISSDTFYKSGVSYYKMSVTL